MNKPARLTRRERKEQKIAQQVAERIEQANKPLFIPKTPANGSLRFNTMTDEVEVYANGKWVNAQTAPEEQP
jgi:hypothetical protein